MPKRPSYLPPKIVVLSRLHARTYRGSEPYIVISVRPPDVAPVKLRPDRMRRARINLAFHDAAPQWGHTAAHNALFSPKQADRIATFVLKNPDMAIIINCMAGISRSAAIAIGIRKGLGFDPGEFAQAPYDPNPHVRELMHIAIKREFGAQCGLSGCGKDVADS